MQIFATDHAVQFLQSVRSPFVREATRWLLEWDDPAPTLLALAGDVGQKLGPFETFRMCALLGLAHSRAVKELGREVLAEPAHDPANLHPFHQALAVAHAHHIWPTIADTPPDGLLDALRLMLNDGPHPTLSALGILCLVGNDGLMPDEQLMNKVFSICDQAKPEEEMSAFPIFLLEATFLNEQTSGLREKALSWLGQRQDADGGLGSASQHQSIRAMETLRTLALSLRNQLGSPHRNVQT